jgi:hypothetical protein
MKQFQRSIAGCPRCLLEFLFPVRVILIHPVCRGKREKALRIPVDVFQLYTAEAFTFGRKRFKFFPKRNISFITGSQAGSHGGEG